MSVCGKPAGLSFPSLCAIDVTKKGRRQLFAVFLIGKVRPAVSETLKSLISCLPA